MPEKTQHNTKKKSLYASQAKTERVANLRLLYWQTVTSFLVENLVFLDKTGFNLGKKRIYGRSQRGTRVVDYSPYYRGEHITIFSAISSQVILGNMTLNGSINTQSFITYIKYVLAPSLWPGAVVIMDNLSSHKNQKVIEILSEVGAKVLFLPPYSPDFNPIEKFWFILKEHLRSLVTMTRDELEKRCSAVLGVPPMTALHQDKV
ncbi:IS630 family transposase [Moorena sp. SIO3I6]|uniref:IS630 family transposase n=1 Tax=Moorena sp. SIO3I6 TaxID=2607831 RepID=UPI0013F8FD64|nr:IS630 family transposase [Moorena sp. SIO3I6]NEP22511.1 IS630 family transposase [Moorena sp. SIO3I6]